MSPIQEEEGLHGRLCIAIYYSVNIILFIAMHHFTDLLAFLINEAILEHFKEFVSILAEILTTFLERKFGSYYINSDILHFLLVCYLE